MVTPDGLRIAVFFRTMHNRIFTPGVASAYASSLATDTPLSLAFRQFNKTIERWYPYARIVA